MPELLIVSNAVLWVVVVALSLIVIALTRQIGVLYERVAPAGALMIGQGLKVGETLPELELDDLGGGKVRIGGAGELSTLVFFLSPSCPVCSSLVPVVKSIAQAERSWLRVVFASDGDPEAQLRYREDQGLSAFPYVLSTELGTRLNVGKLPYAALIDEAGILRAKGLTNSREHLESLFEAKEEGVASIQEYLQKQQGRDEQSAAQ